MLKGGDAVVVDARDSTEVGGSGKTAGGHAFLVGECWRFRAEPVQPFHDKAFGKRKDVILYYACGGSLGTGRRVQDMGHEQVFKFSGCKDWTGTVEK